MLSRQVLVATISVLIFFCSTSAAIASSPPPQPSPGAFLDFPTLFLRAPLKSAVWPSGSQQVITWTYMDFPGPTAKIILLKNNKPILTIATGVLIDNQSFCWEVPVSLAPGKDYQLRIVSERYNYCKSTSDNFTITPQ